MHQRNKNTDLSSHWSNLRIWDLSRDLAVVLYDQLDYLKTHVQVNRNFLTNWLFVSSSVWVWKLLGCDDELSYKTMTRTKMRALGYAFTVRYIWSCFVETMNINSSGIWEQRTEANQDRLFCHLQSGVFVISVIVSTFFVYSTLCSRQRFPRRLLC